MKRILLIILLVIPVLCNAQGPTFIGGRTDRPRNLIKNSGFGVWSYSELAQGTTGAQSDFEYGTAEQYDDCEDDDTGDYTLVDCTMALDAGTGVGASNCYEVTETAATQSVSFTCSGLTIGHDYKFSLYLKDGTYTITSSDEMQSINNAGTITLNTTYLTGCAAWSDFSVIWRATETNNKCILVLNMGAGQTILIDEWRIIEVTPGRTAADNYGPDLWNKDTTLYTFREPNGSNTQNGLYYSAKLSPTAASDYIRYPVSGLLDDPVHLIEFQGKTVTFACWGKTSTSSHLRIRIYDDAYTNSPYHSGGGGFEWISITDKISGTATQVFFEIQLVQSSGDSYISQPMLIYGDSLAEGQYACPPDEIVYFDSYVDSHKFYALSNQTDQTGTVYLGGDSSAIIPYGSKAVRIYVIARDNLSSGQESFFASSYDLSSVAKEFVFSMSGLGNNLFEYASGWTNLNVDSDYEYEIDASPGGNVDFLLVRYHAVQLR